MRPTTLTGSAPPKDPTVEELVDQIFIEAQEKGIAKAFIERSTGIAHVRLWRIERYEYQPRLGELLDMCAAVGSDLIEIAAKAIDRRHTNIQETAS